MEIDFLKAEHGDCILISYIFDSKKRNILIDTGTRNTYLEQNGNRKGDGALKKKIKALKLLGEKIDLLIITHVDNDHIGGVIKWFLAREFDKNMIGKIWFNSGKLIHEYLKFHGLIWSSNEYSMTLKDYNYQYNRFYDNSLKFIYSDNGLTSTKDGVTFEKKIVEWDLWDKKLIVTGNEYTKFGANFKILSPTKSRLVKLLKKWETENPNSTTSSTMKNKQKEDYLTNLIDFDTKKFKQNRQIHNGSSISFILEINNKKMLFLADSFPSDICKSLDNLGFNCDKRLSVEFVKLSHHGSRENTNLQLLNLINTKKYVISSNGKKHGHPNKVIFARILEKDDTSSIYFNYDLKSKIFTSQDYVDYPKLKENIFSTEELTI